MVRIVAVKIGDKTLPVRREENIGGYVRAHLYPQRDGTTDAYVVFKDGGKQEYFIDIPEDEWLDRKVEFIVDLRRSVVCNAWADHVHFLRKKERDAERFGVSLQQDARCS
jgi:hypothetical protein